jgi:hypothetical protein
VAGTSTGSCAVAGFHICIVVRSGSTIVLVPLLENSRSED